MKVIEEAVAFRVLCPFCRAVLEFDTSDLKEVETEKGTRGGIIHCPVCDGEFSVKNENGIFYQDVQSIYPAAEAAPEEPNLFEGEKN